jgi:membrane associated rhomboid family serine protease
MARINLPPLTRSLLIILIGFTALNSMLRPGASALAFFVRTGRGSPLLSLVPGQSFKYPWTLVSATFVEQNIFGLIVTGLTLFFGGRYLERAWGMTEFAKFILIVCLIPNTLCFTTYIFFYEASKSNRAL